MANKYFKKENLRNQVHVKNTRTPIVFQPVGGDTGVIECDEASEVCKSLNELADQRIGGVVRVSPEIFESLKKNAISTPSPKPSFLNQIRSNRPIGSFGNQDAQPVAVKTEAPPSGIRVMDSDQTPPSSIGSFKARFKPSAAAQPLK
jgi:hypothetical protein